MFRDGPHDLKHIMKCSSSDEIPWAGPLYREEIVAE